MPSSALLPSYLRCFHQDGLARRCSATESPRCRETPQDPVADTAVRLLPVRAATELPWSLGAVLGEKQ